MENLYFTKIIKVGDSCAIIIPKGILSGVGLQRGDTILFGQFAPGQFSVGMVSDKKIQELKNYTVTPRIPKLYD